MHVEDGWRRLRQLPQQQHARQAQVLLARGRQPLDAALDLPGSSRVGAVEGQLSRSWLVSGTAADKPQCG